MNIDCAKLPIMKAHCKKCPFKPDENGKWQDTDLANRVIERTLFKSHQICHGTESKDRVPNNRCKGLFDHNFEIYDRMGYGHLIAK